MVVKADVRQALDLNREMHHGSLVTFKVWNSAAKWHDSC